LKKSLLSYRYFGGETKVSYMMQASLKTLSKTSLIKNFFGGRSLRDHTKPSAGKVSRYQIVFDKNCRDLTEISIQGLIAGALKAIALNQKVK
jgi:hypothetical protein